MPFDKESYFQEKFSKVALEGGKISSRLFDECEFEGCTFTGATFDQCRFLRCKFTECDLSGIIPMDSQYQETTFYKCKSIGIDWTKAQKTQELIFEECQMDFSNFRLMKLPKTRMAGCQVKEADFIEADLSKSYFRNTNFENSIFFKTNLSEADFTGAKNYTIDVTNNNIRKARFSLPEALSLLSGFDIIIE